MSAFREKIIISEIHLVARKFIPHLQLRRNTTIHCNSYKISYKFPFFPNPRWTLPLWLSVTVRCAGHLFCCCAQLRRSYFWNFMSSLSKFDKIYHKQIKSYKTIFNIIFLKIKSVQLINLYIFDVNFYK